MPRKLSAFFILIGVIGALILAYLYFFVYYTSTLVIYANVREYKVELFSKTTAIKYTHDCEQEECIIQDVSPFDYNITISKTSYNPQVIPMKVSSRKREEIYINLEKKVQLEPVILIEYPESLQEKVIRIRQENKYYVSFQIPEDSKIVFQEQGDQIKMILQKNKRELVISDFPKVQKSQISIQDISGNQDLYIRLGVENFIYDMTQQSLIKLPYQIEVYYIKAGRKLGEYIVITEKGAFLYSSGDKTSEYQYLFRDYLYAGNDFIGIIYKDEIQKKENFNLTQEGNLIIRYNSQTKTRKIIYSTQENIDSIKWQAESIILTAGEDIFELKNF